MILCLYSLLVTSSSLLLSGCGWHLRGAESLPPALERTYIDIGNRHGRFAAALESALEAGGVRVVEERSEASAVVVIQQHGSRRRVLSVGASGQVREHELIYEVTFSVEEADGEPLLSESEVRLTRDFAFDPEAVLGKASEQERLEEDLERDAVQLVMRRLTAVESRKSKVE